ncbi:MAG: signal peptidase II [Negativicutes bacterium]|nr:signal peptidase II [Negativicutes bacterium]
MRKSSWWIFLVLLILDQWSKYLVMKNMYLGQSIPLITDVFHLTYIINPGAAFGLLANQQLFFIFVAVGVLLGGLWGIHKFSEQYGKLFVYGIVIFMAGAVGNLIDRIRFAGVVDFLDFRIWPIFNLADIGIVCGAALLGWTLWKADKKEGIEL